MKLYKASSELSVVFFSEEDDISLLRKSARHWLKEEEDRNGTTMVEVAEVYSLDDLPKGWDFDNVPWGGDDTSCKEWFRKEKFRQEKTQTLETIEELKTQIAFLNEKVQELEKSI